MAHKKGQLQEMKYATGAFSVEITKEGKKLKRKKRWDKSSMHLIIFCTMSIVLFSVFTVVNSFFNSNGRYLLNLDYGSVCVETYEGEKYSPMSDYTAIDVFGRLNWTFSQQSNWYSEMHGKVDTVIEQTVSTYKKFNNGILISADLTNSSLINSANQFCYLKDQDLVMWRKAAGGASTYDGFDTPWSEGDPYRTMTISGQDGFKATNGLPAYELSVYVIEEHTVESATPIVRREDGLYTVTYTLIPNTWEEEDEGGNLITKGATAYYANQMIFSGGLPEAPQFHSISYTVVFDEDWRVFQTDIAENYDAKYGPVTAKNCLYTATTIYEYNTERADSIEYEEYFQNYTDAPVENGAPEKKDPTALDCLASAFGQVLTEPASFDLALSVDGSVYEGAVNLDLSKTNLSEIDLSLLEIKANVGPLYLWLEGGEAYLNYGGAKLKVELQDLIDLLGTSLNAGSGEQDLLGALGNGEFTFTEQAAELHSVLPLGEFSLPVNFYFRLQEDGVKLDRVTTALSLEGTDIGIGLSFGTRQLPALEEAARAEYIPLLPYAERLAKLFRSDVLCAKISYQNKDVVLNGDLSVDLQPISACGTLHVKAGALEKTIRIAYLEKTIYLDLDGIKLSAGLEEGVALLEKYVDLPEIGGGELSVGDLLNRALSESFASLIQTSSEQDKLLLAIKGNEFLQAFGIDFELGDVALEVSEEGIKAELLGITALVSEGEPFEISTEGYLSILPYAEELIELFRSETLSVKANYAGETLSAVAEGAVDLKAKAATFKITLGYRSAQKTFDILLSDGVVYLCADGIRVSANLEAAAALLSDEISIPDSDVDARALVEKILSLDLGRLISLTDESDRLSVMLDGTLLLQTLGIDFELGDVSLELSDGVLKANAYGAAVEITKGGAFTLEKEDYIDLLTYAKAVRDLLSEEYLRASVNYQGEKLGVQGTIDLDCLQKSAKAELSITYGKIQKDATVFYEGGEIYLSVEGIRFKANAEEAIAFVTELAGVSEEDAESRDILEDLLGTDFSALLKEMSEKDGALQLVMNGTLLLQTLGIDFELGDVSLELSDGVLKANAYGAAVEITKGGAFTLEKEDYIDLLTYAKAVRDLLSEEYLRASVNYQGEKLGVQGTIDLDCLQKSAKAELAITYGKIQKDATVFYEGGEIYLSVEGIRFKANAEEAIAFVTELAGVSEEDAESRDILEDLLGTDFSALLKEMNEKDGALQLVMNGTLLLQTLGIDFELGDVSLELSDGVLKANAYGAAVEITKGGAFTLEKEDYIDLLTYAYEVKDLLSTGSLNLSLHYQKDEFSVSGEMQIKLSPFEGRGTLTLSYHGAQKKIDLLVASHTVYLDLEGLKLSVDVNRLVELFRQDDGVYAKDMEGIIESLLEANFSELLTVRQSGSALEIAVEGTSLLKKLGSGIKLGEVKLSLDENGLTANALQAELKAVKEENYREISEEETQGFVEISAYLPILKDLLAQDAFMIGIDYRTGNLSLRGDVRLSVSDLKKNFKEADQMSAEEIKSILLGGVRAEATLKLGYTDEEGHSVEQDFDLVYLGETIYLSVGDLKLKTTLQSVIDAVKTVLPESAPREESSAIEALFKLPYGQYFGLTEEVDEGNWLALSVKGSELLKDFGKEFDLGEVRLRLGEGGLQISALNAEISIAGIQEFSTQIEKESYRDLGRIPEKIASIIRDKKIFFSGDVTLGYGKEEIALNVTSGFLSFADDSFALDLKGEIVFLEQAEPFTLRVTPGEKGSVIKLVFQDLGVIVDLGEIDTLKEAFTSLKERAEAVSAKIVGENRLSQMNKIPGMEKLSSIFAASAGGKTVLDVLSEVFGVYTIEDLVNGLQFGGSERENMLFSWQSRDLFVGVCDEISSDGMLGAELSYHTEDEKISVHADVHADSTAEPFPTEKDGAGLCYLGVEHFASLLNQLEAAIGILEEKELNYSLSGKVVANGAERYEIKGGIYYSLDSEEEEVPFRLADDSIVVSSHLNLTISLDVVAKNADDKSVYLDFYLFDGAPDGNSGYTQDGNLDFYVKASIFGREADGQTPEGYDPIKLYAPSPEIMTVLSGALSIVGMDDVDLLNRYLISKWLPDENSTARFHALGSSLLSNLTKSFGKKIAPVTDILKKLGAFASEGTLDGVKTESLSIPHAENGWISRLETTENSFTLGLDSEAIYQSSELEDLTIRLTRAQGKQSNYYLSELSLENIYNKERTEKTSLSISATDEKPADMKPTDPDSYTSFAGVDKLLLSLIDSATHQTEDGDYAVNPNFYIDGNAGLRLNIGIDLAKIDIKKIALSVDLDENNDVVINAHLEYDAVKNVLVALWGTVIINGDSSLDLTIKNNMVYMKRTQTSYYNWLTQEKNYSTPQYEYRSMTMDEFTADIMNQMKFIFNFSDQLFDFIVSKIPTDQGNSGEVQLDAGAQLKKYITDFTYQKEKTDSWKLVLNGKGLANSDAIGDITVNIGNDEQGLIRTLGADLSIASVIKVEAGLKWHNPANVMDAGVENLASDISEEVLSKIAK